jgi:damage-control phosphatase, subfamily I
MQTYPECIPCLIRHAGELAKHNLPDHARQGFLDEILAGIEGFDRSKAPPFFALEMYRTLRRRSGLDDPYAGRKALSNRKALDLVQKLRLAIESSPDRLEACLRIAVAGNIIDFGIDENHGAGMEETLERAQHARFAVDDSPELKARLRHARQVLYIADNAGEIVFDRLLIEEIGPGRVTCAVRSAPIINDATLLDAAQAGLDRICRVIASGSEASGTPLELCSNELRNLVAGSDVVISKGQGNFETLCDAGREVFHLFMVKCQVISDEVGAPLGSFMVMNRS